MERLEGFLYILHILCIYCVLSCAIIDGIKL